VKKKGMSVEDVALALQFSKDSYEDLESGRTTAEEWGPKLPLIATKLQTPTVSLLSSATRPKILLEVNVAC